MDRGLRPGSFCVLPDARLVGVRARAPEEPVEVAVGGPGSCRAAGDAEDDVEERIGQGMAYGQAPEVHKDLYDLPPCCPDEPDRGAGDHGVQWRVEELVVAPAAVDDLGGYRDEGEGRYEVGYLVVERDRLEEVPQKAGPVQGGAEQNEGYYPVTRHLLALPVSSSAP